MGISRYPNKVIATRVTGNVDGSVASVSGNVGGNVVGSVGSLTDLSEYNILSAVGPVANAAYTSVVDVTGKGFLSTATALSGGGASNVSYIKITIDGTVVVAAAETFNSNQKVTGLCQVSDIITTATIAVFAYNGGALDPKALSGYYRNYPYTTEDTTSGIVVVHSPIFFKSSLLVEVKYAVGNNNAGYYVAYGVAS